MMDEPREDVFNEKVEALLEKLTQDEDLRRLIPYLKTKVNFDLYILFQK